MTQGSHKFWSVIGRHNSASLALKIQYYPQIIGQHLWIGTTLFGGGAWHILTAPTA
jgi:hypothetical protein